MKNLIVRDLRPDDLGKVRAIATDFPFPDLSNLLYFKQKVAEVNGEIVAAVFVRLTAEGILVVDESAPKTLRTRAAVELINTAKRETYEMGLDEWHAFVQNPTMENLLRRIGFTYCVGKPMVVSYGEAR